MKPGRMILVLAATLLVVPLAMAQMGGGHHGPQPTPGNGPGGGMHRPDDDMNGEMGMSGRFLIVGTDGVIYTIRPLPATASEDRSAEILAIRPTGTTAWTTKVEGHRIQLQLSGNLLLVASGEEGRPDESHLVALSTASGAEQWHLLIDGFTAAIEPFSGGAYVSVVKVEGANGDGMHDGRNGDASVERSLLAIDNAGKVLWTLDLD